MPAKYLEKNFLYLIMLSLLLHAAAFGLFSLMPREREAQEKKVTMVELTNLPEPPHAQPVTEPEPEPEPQPGPERKPVRVPNKLPPAPGPPAKVATLPPDVPIPRPASRPKADAVSPAAARPQKETSAPVKGETNQPAPAGRAESVSRPPEKGGEESVRGTTRKIELSKLFPSAKKLGSLEESYRNKYKGAEKGDTRMIDTDDPSIAVYSRRLLEAANGSANLQWSKSSLREKSCVAVLKVTVSRDGTIEAVDKMESGCAPAVDKVNIDSIFKAGFLGPLPKTWPHEKLKLIWISLHWGPAAPP